MFGKPVLDVGSSRSAEPDEIRCDAMCDRRNQRNNFPPCMTSLDARAEKAQPTLRDLPLPGRPWWNPEHSLGAIQHQSGQSFQLLEYSSEDNVLEAVECGPAAFDLHTESCTLLDVRRNSARSIGSNVAQKTC
jgi:hypothetical protein